MSSVGNDPRKFKIEGSGRMLEALAEAIELALRAARATPYRTGEGSIVHGFGNPLQNRNPLAASRAAGS
jgi:hypothetical protein